MEMENKKLDRLFREKSANYEVQPSGEAWGAISSQISHKTNSKVIYWRVAASLFIMLGVSWLLLERSDKEHLVSRLSDHPTIATIEVPLFSDFQIGEEAIAPSSESVSSNGGQLSVAQIEIALEPNTMRSIGPNLTRKGLEPIHDTPAIIALQIPSSTVNVVKIKYIANNTVDEENGKKGIGNWLAKAQELKPGQLFADLRAAKNDLVASKKY